MIAGTEPECQSDAGSTKDTPYLALTGEIRAVFCEYLWENWPRYNGTALYAIITELDIAKFYIQQTEDKCKQWSTLWVHNPIRGELRLPIVSNLAKRLRGVSFY